jgi:hypothetical protein
MPDAAATILRWPFVGYLAPVYNPKPKLASVGVLFSFVVLKGV